MKKKVTALIAALLMVQTTASTVFAYHTGEAVNTPVEDSSYTEMTLEDFRKENPGYRGYAESISTRNIVETEEGQYTWKQVGDNWYLYAPSGSQVIGDWFLSFDGNWYYLKPTTGAMQTGWLQYGSYWYYFNGGGIMQTDWYQVGSAWYYLRTDYINSLDGKPVGSAVTGAYYLPTSVGSTKRTRNYYFDYNCAMQDWTYPVSTNYVTLSSCFNDPRPDKNHQGIDIPAASNTAIKSCTNGTVHAAGWDKSMGYYTIITSNVEYAEKKPLILRYMHMIDEPLVGARYKNVVSEGQVMGYVGSTGDSTGPHLHLDINDQGLYDRIKVASCVNPSSFFPNVTLLQGASAEVPPYGADYCYAR